MNRQDDLLLRLKNCVGQIQNKSKQSSYSTKKYSDKSFHRNGYDQNLDNSFQSSTKRKDMNLIDRNSTNKNQNIHSQRRKSNNFQDQQNILLRTKRYLQRQQNDNKSYWTDRKTSIPLNQSTNLLSLKKNIFSNQNQQQKLRSMATKNVTESTKKRILQRASLIDEQIEKITPKKTYQNQTNSDLYQKSFLERLNEKKNQYAYERDQNFIQKQRTFKQSPFKNNYLNSTQKQSLKRNQFIAENEVSNKIKFEPSKKGNLQKYENYSKFSMETLVKQNDLRKTQKMQKLKKITLINEGINNRIRKLVDNFENYLTHRVIQ